jgi:3-oxoacyl-[acyl-carrier-protein] synthase-3
MTSRIPVGIAGTGAYLPDREVSNEWFEGFLDTSNEWIVQRTGIETRRFAADDQATSDLSTAAGRQAIEAAGLAPEDIDLIVLGTLTPDFLLPSTACIVQEQLGATNAGAWDVNAACTGFLTAFSTAEAFIAAGRARHVLAIGAETLSRFIDLEDRGSCILFGDAAGAAVLSPLADCNQGEILKTTLGADGKGYDFIHMKAGGARRPASPATVAEGDHYIRLRGREIYKFAVKYMSELIREMLADHDPDDFSLLVPHQVNLRIIDAALDRLGMTRDRVVINIQRYANTSAATVPVALDEAVREGRIEKGKLVVLVAFGAGLTWGASLVRW